MTRAWKPGDVALVTWTDDFDGATETSVRVFTPHGTADEPAGRRRAAWWGGDGYLRADMKGLEIHPLAVIDPERDADRFYDAYRKASGVADIDENRDAMQAALREFANPTPPKPKTLLDRLKERAPDGLIDPALAEQVVKEWLYDSSTEEVAR
jgi:hypothetical protein